MRSFRRERRGRRRPHRHKDHSVFLTMQLMMRKFLLFRLLVCFLGILAGAPATAEQSDKPPRVTGLMAAILVQSPEAQQFRQGLRDLGYAEGRDVLVEWRSAEGDYSRLPAALAETINSKPDVIVVEGTVAALRVKQALPAVPLVMAVVG